MVLGYFWENQHEITMKKSWTSKKKHTISSWQNHGKIQLFRVLQHYQDRLGPCDIEACVHRVSRRLVPAIESGGLWSSGIRILGNGMKKDETFTHKIESWDVWLIFFPWLWTFLVFMDFVRFLWIVFPIFHPCLKKKNWLFFRKKQFTSIHKEEKRKHDDFLA